MIFGASASVRRQINKCHEISPNPVSHFDWRHVVNKIHTESMIARETWEEMMFLTMGPALYLLMD